MLLLISSDAEICHYHLLWQCVCVCLWWTWCKPVLVNPYLIASYLNSSALHACLADSIAHHSTGNVTPNIPYCHCNELVNNGVVYL